MPVKCRWHDCLLALYRPVYGTLTVPWNGTDRVGEVICTGQTAPYPIDDPLVRSILGGHRKMSRFRLAESLDSGDLRWQRFKFGPDDVRLPRYPSTRSSTAEAKADQPEEECEEES
eukprot:1202631-Pyramimonas_sp.AAC.3